MKRIIYFAALATLALGCQKVDIEENNVGGSLTKREVTITVNSSESGAPISKVGYNPNTETGGIDIVWSEGDALNVVSQDFSLSKFEMVEGSISDDATTAQFAGSITGEKYRLVYPHDADAQNRGNELDIDISSQIVDMCDNGLSSMSKYNYMVSPWLNANDTNTEVTMQHIGAAVKIGMRFEGLNPDIDYTLSMVDFGEGIIPVESNIDLNTDITNEDFHLSLNLNGVSAEVENSPSIVNYTEGDASSEYYLFLSILPIDTNSADSNLFTLDVTLSGSDGNDYKGYFEFYANNTIDLARASYTSFNYRCDMTDADVSERLFEGKGTAASPYLIQTTEDLWALSASEASYTDCHFRVTADIDLGCNAENPWTPISSQESITFDGGNHTISGLYINSKDSRQGLFSEIYYSTITNLTVEGEVTSNSNNIGGLTGYCCESYILNCHSRVNAAGTSRVGGLLGNAGHSYVINCSSQGTITGDDEDGRVGGLTGTSSGAVITNCYSVGAVTNISGEAYGLAAPGGSGFGIISNCYFEGDFEGTDPNAAAKSSTDMLKTEFVDELNSGDITYAVILGYIDAKIKKWTTQSDGYPITSEDEEVEIGNSLFSGGDGTESSPYLISTADDMFALSSWWSFLEEYSYLLVTNDINLGCSEDKQWSPIGNYDNDDLYDMTFDGGGNTISGIYIDSEEEYQGLFGHIYSCYIYNLTIEGEVTSTSKNAGGIAGKMKYCYITNCHNRATITGTSRVGGISGSGGNCSIINCSNTGDITGDDSKSRVGGIAGTSNSADIINSYNTGSVTNTSGTSYAIIGLSGEGELGNITNCYALENSGTADIDATLSSEFMASEEFVGWLNSYLEENIDYLTETYGDVYMMWTTVDGGYPTTTMTPVEPTDYSALFAGGDGSEESPFQIATVDQLKILSNKCSAFNDKHFKLTCDLDLEGSADNQWRPIGDRNTPFIGNTFDGAEHTIKGVYIDSGEFAQGLFGFSYYSTISNLTVEGDIKTTAPYCGGIAGYVDKLNFVNCHNRINVTGTESVGGIAGHSSSSKIINCSNSGKIKGTHFDDSHSNTSLDLQNVGGILGHSGFTFIYGCYNVGTVENTLGEGFAIAAPAPVGMGPTYAFNCYYSSECGGVDPYSSATAMNDADMKTTEFVELLNSSLTATNEFTSKAFGLVPAYGWVATDSYPTTSVDAGTTGGDGTLPDNYGEVDTGDTGGGDTGGGDTGGGDSGDTYFSGGDGTSENPYQISTKEDMYELAKWTDELNGLHFLVTADIDLEGSENNKWIKIGYYTDSGTFENCVFDGGDHTISGLYVDVQGYGALFDDVKNSTICNLTVEGSVTVQYDTAAGIAVEAVNSYFVGCHNNVTIKGVSQVGGIAAKAENCYLLNCSNRATITSNYIYESENVVFTYAGGLAGNLDGGVVYGCYNTGELVNQAAAGTIDPLFYHDTDDTEPIYCYNNYYSDNCNAQDLFSTAKMVTVSEMMDNAFVSDAGINRAVFSVNRDPFFESVPVPAYAWVAVPGSTPTTSIDGGIDKGSSYMPDDYGLVDFTIDTDSGDSSNDDGLFSGGDGSE